MRFHFLSSRVKLDKRLEVGREERRQEKKNEVLRGSDESMSSAQHFAWLLMNMPVRGAVILAVI